jgi:glycosyltransferase involved in cell wall biosynthesis
MPPIVLVGPAHPLRGGIVHFGAGLARALRERGDEVRLLSFSRLYPGLLFPGRSQLDASASPAAAGWAGEPLLDSIAPWTWTHAASRAASWRPRRAVLMHWMPFFAPAYAVLARRLRRSGVRCVLLCHNLHPHEPGPFDRWLSRLLLDSVDGAVVLSGSVERELRALAPSLPLRRAEHPVVDVFGKAPPRAEARAALGLSERDLVLLFFGLVRPYKGLEALLRALPAVLAHRPCRLIVAGEFYEPRGPTERLLDELGLRAAVRLLDRYVPDEEVPALFAAADLCVQPYLAASQSGVSKLAFQFGTPVLLTDVGGLAEEVEDGVTGFAVPPGDPAALAAAILRFDGLRVRHDFGAAVRRASVRFGWGPLLQALDAVTP